MSGRVVGKKALITGAAQGLGAASAWGLAREGARVLLTDVNEAGARQVAEAIDAELGAASRIRCATMFRARTIGSRRSPARARRWAACRCS